MDTWVRGRASDSIKNVPPKLKQKSILKVNNFSSVTEASFKILKIVSLVSE